MKKVILLFVLVLLCSCAKDTEKKDAKQTVVKTKENKDKDVEKEKEFEKIVKMYENKFKDIETDKKEDKFYLLSNEVPTNVVKETLKKSQELLAVGCFDIIKTQDLNICSPYSVEENFYRFPLTQDNKILGQILVVKENNELKFSTSKLQDEFLNYMLDKKGIYKYSYKQRLDDTKPYPVFELVDRNKVEKGKNVVDITKVIYTIKVK